MYDAENDPRICTDATDIRQFQELFSSDDYIATPSQSVVHEHRDAGRVRAGAPAGAGAVQI